MVDFRRVLTALAVLALLTGFAVSANAQLLNQFSCTAQASVPPLLRSEGITELVGDIVIQCTGGTPTGATLPLPTANFAVFLGNTTVTSRTIGPNGFSEALLLVDEPGTALGNNVSFSVNGVAQGCGLTACLAGAVNPNVFPGTVSGNAVTFIGVPVNPPGSTGVRIFRITNVRINANAIGTSSGGVFGNQVLAFVTISGSTSVPVTAPQQVVGFVQQGLNFSLRKYDESDSGSTLGPNQCVKLDPAANGITLRFGENFATAFKIQSQAVQNMPGSIYNTESGLEIGPAGTGLADFGTRLRAVFKNIPAGVNVYVPIQNNGSTNAAAGNAKLIGVSDLQASTVNTAINSPFVLTANDGGATAVPSYKLPLDSTGAGVAIWEVVAANPLVLENFDFQVALGFTASPGTNSPATGVTGTVAGTFAPVSTALGNGDKTVPIPRFVEVLSPKSIITVNLCRTQLLFPFVTTNGFETGIAVTNTSLDKGVYATTPQSGTCTYNFYGDNAPAPYAPAAAIAGGSYFAFGVTAQAPNFSGYMIAQCNFQYAHGFAYITSGSLGSANAAAMGYLALVLPAPTTGSRALGTAFNAASETLVQ
jgi:hypothetical protein